MRFIKINRYGEICEAFYPEDVAKIEERILPIGNVRVEAKTTAVDNFFFERLCVGGAEVHLPVFPQLPGQSSSPRFRAAETPWFSWERMVMRGSRSAYA